MALMKRMCEERPEPFFSVKCGPFFVVCGYEQAQKGSRFDAHEEEIDWEPAGEGFVTAKSDGLVYSFGPSPSISSTIDAEPNVKRLASRTLLDRRLTESDSNLKRSASRTTSDRQLTRKVSFKNPDFSGTWIVNRTEGDWNAFTEEIGYGYMKRKGLAALRWGVGLLTEEIKMDKDTLWIKNSSSISTSVMDVQIDNTAQDTIDQDHVPIKLTLWWEEGRLEATSVTKSTGKPMAQITRTMEDGDIMKVVFRSPSGMEAVRIMVRQ
jgi:hypothetical protein